MIQGIHHISMKCTAAELPRVRAFYCDVLGLTAARVWPEGVLFDTGNGFIEVFTTGEGTRDKGAVRHFALACDDVDGMAERIRQAGYEVTIQPKDIVIPAQPPLPARIAFCSGPLGEEIELFCSSLR